MLIINKAKCTKCGDVIESKHIHDYVSCSCGNISVDGGSDYCRRSAKTNEYVDLSIELNDELCESLVLIGESCFSKQINGLGITKSFLKTIYNSGYEIIKRD